MIEPEKLVKKTKSISISLRIDEETYDAFKEMAKKFNTKAGSMMANLIEEYAKEYKKGTK